MNKSMLRKRLHYIEASPIPKRASHSIFSKRDVNHITEESHPNSEFNSFFDYEDDLSSIKPSNEFFIEDRDTETTEGFVLEEELAGKSYSGIEMEDVGPNDLTISEESVNNVINNDNDSEEKLFEISDSNCIYFLSNGNRCKENKESSSLFCKLHQQI